MGLDAKFFKLSVHDGQRTAEGIRSMARFISPTESSQTERRWSYWPMIEAEARELLVGLDEGEELWYTSDDIYDLIELDEYVGRGWAWRVDDAFLQRMRGIYDKQNR